MLLSPEKLARKTRGYRHPGPLISKRATGYRPYETSRSAHQRSARPAPIESTLDLRRSLRRPRRQFFPPHQAHCASFARRRAKPERQDNARASAPTRSSSGTKRSRGPPFAG